MAIMGDNKHFLNINLQQKAGTPKKRKAATEDALKESTSGTNNTPKKHITSTATTEYFQDDTETVRAFYSPMANAIKQSTDTTIKALACPNTLTGFEVSKSKLALNRIQGTGAYLRPSKNKPPCEHAILRDIANY